MFLRRLKLPDFRGDTIVEVMVVLTVLGMAIGISYATANSSLIATRRAQENAQATEYAQAQIEALRTLTQAGSSPNIFVGGPYCLNLPVSCNISTQAFNYHVAITYTNTPTKPNTFKVTVSWPDIQGYGNDTVILNYRLYPS